MEKKEMNGVVFNECLLMNIFPTECPHGHGVGVSQMETAAGRRKGESKITKNVRTSFMDGP